MDDAAIDQEQKESTIPPDPGSEAAWRSVVHRLSASLGLIRTAEPEFCKLSDTTREIMEDGIGRLLKLVGACVRNQEQARRLEP